MLTSAKGNLTIVDGFLVYWKGVPVTGVDEVVVHADAEQQHIKLIIVNGNVAQMDEMETAGIKIKRRTV